MIDLEGLEKYLDSDEGQEKLDDFINGLIKSREVKDRQLIWLHTRLMDRNNFDEIIEKVILKYRSDEYRDSWYDRGIEPPEKLFSFLYDYAEKYGRECTEGEWRKYSNLFSSNLLYVNGYFFNKVNGQGTFIDVIKEKGED